MMPIWPSLRFVQFYTTEEESEDQSDIVKATFRAWDIDRNGKLSKREFFSVPPKNISVEFIYNKYLYIHLETDI